MTCKEICLNQKITLKLFLLCCFGSVSFAFDAKLIAMVVVEVTGRPQISFCLGCELSLVQCPFSILLSSKTLTDFFTLCHCKHIDYQLWGCGKCIKEFMPLNM